MGLLRSRATWVALGLFLVGLGGAGCSGRDDPPPSTDAGSARDAGGGALDGGGTTDGAVPTDASSPTDAGAPADAGPRTDASIRLDASAADAGPARDAGGGGPLDAGPSAECAPQDAHGEGLCDGFFGYFWDGSSCYGVTGCSCVGASCGSGWTSDTECAAAHAGCTGTDCRSPGMSCPAGQSCEACLGVGGVLYVCLPAGSVC